MQRPLTRWRSARCFAVPGWALIPSARTLIHVAAETTGNPRGTRDTVVTGGPSGAAMARTDTGQDVLGRFDLKGAVIPIDLAVNPQDRRSMRNRPSPTALAGATRAPGVRGS